MPEFCQNSAFIETSACTKGWATTRQSFLCVSQCYHWILVREHTGKSSCPQGSLLPLLPTLESFPNPMATSQLLCDTLGTPCCSQGMFPPAEEGFAWCLGTSKGSPESSLLQPEQLQLHTSSSLRHKCFSNQPLVALIITEIPHLSWSRSLEVLLRWSSPSTMCAQVRESPGSGERRIWAVPTPELRHFTGRWSSYKVMGINTRMRLNPTPTASALGLPGYFTLNWLWNWNLAMKLHTSMV